MERKQFLQTLTTASLGAMSMKATQFVRQFEDAPGSEKMPLLFVGHGDPRNALRNNAFTQSLARTGAAIASNQPPRAVLVVSAHWLTRGSYVCAHPQPETIYDFGGFEQALYEVQYPAPGAPEIAREVAAAIPEVEATEQWGLDHGAWTVLKHIFPKADIPVFQLSIDYHKPMQYHYDLARKLRFLREKGVLILGSGNIVHNLRLSMPKLMQGDAAPFDWAMEFDEWVKGRIEARDFQALVDYDQQGQMARLAVPTVDHYVPMLYNLALIDPHETITQEYEEVSHGGMSMRTFRVG